MNSKAASALSFAAWTGSYVNDPKGQAKNKRSFKYFGLDNKGESKCGSFCGENILKYFSS